MSVINNNRAVFGVNVGHLWDETQMVNGWMTTLLSYYRDGHIEPHIDATFSFEKASEAHQYIQDRKNFGKVLLVP